MARSDRAASVAELTEKFSSSSSVLLTDYRGLTVAQLKQLRRALGETASYAVTKNTLTSIAAREAGVEGIDEMLAGPTAIAFVDGDVVTAAKGLRDFAKANPLLVIKGGVLDGKTLTSAEVAKLADLESREVLLAKLAGAMQGTLQQAVSLFAAPLAQAARVFGALQTAADADPTLIGGAGEQTQEPDSIESSDTEPVAAAADDTEDAAPVADSTSATDSTTDSATDNATDSAAEDAAATTNE
jgi:large subunit ribosomal protein L10